MWVFKKTPIELFDYLLRLLIGKCIMLMRGENFHGKAKSSYTDRSIR